MKNTKAILNGIMQGTRYSRSRAVYAYSRAHGLGRVPSLHDSFRYFLSYRKKRAPAVDSRIKYLIGRIDELETFIAESKCPDQCCTGDGRSWVGRDDDGKDVFDVCTDCEDRDRILGRVSSVR